MESSYCLTDDILNWMKESRSLGVFTTDEGLNIKSINEWLQTRSQCNPDEVKDRYLFEVYPEILSRQLHVYYDQAIQGQMSILSRHSIEYLIQLPSSFEDYSHMQQNAIIAPLLDWNKVVGTITIIDDVTSKHLMPYKRKLLIKDELCAQDEWQLTFDAVPDLIAIIDKDHRIKRINKSIADSLGIKPEDAIGKFCYQLVHRTTAPPFFCPHNKLLSDGEPHSSDFYEETLKKYLNVTVIPCFDSEKNLISSIHIARDISEQLRNEQLLKNLSITDELTGLYNRKGFMTLTKQMMNTSNRLSYRMLIFFMDLNGMKFINEIFGHLEGDHALRGAATILRNTFRETDVIARYGGDEFIVSAMLTGDADYNKIIERLDKKVNLFNAQISKIYKLSFSIGVAIYDPNRPVSLEDLISLADALMREVKYKTKLRDEDNSIENE